MRNVTSHGPQGDSLCSLFEFGGPEHESVCQAAHLTENAQSDPGWVF